MNYDSSDLLQIDHIILKDTSIQLIELELQAYGKDSLVTYTSARIDSTNNDLKSNLIIEKKIMNYEKYYICNAYDLETFNKIEINQCMKDGIKKSITYKKNIRLFLVL
ncbi:hypothetical protein KMW28_25135 [Flammeovirga yaeyamensis]|uniref:Uncharacterized protein n=1 Tax=Flammeovirga yaeyamensis TaxID=367791 RepID=A0AAX1N9C4_9BACT|nr:hypothetical protein [Flammeovirga yaeyamensis]MBB3699423.1 hypothetical protein [Flammeovirga yaeyamensis]NMF35319.1 hypothetical protein [Flammeovirga yaeyamensis]QWG04179.1 hypothetical protein KMW28_25135 [Flammeovirga yaeyamensis]